MGLPQYLPIELYMIATNSIFVPLTFLQMFRPGLCLSIKNKKILRRYRLSFAPVRHEMAVFIISKIRDIAICVCFSDEHHKFPSYKK